MGNKKNRRDYVRFGIGNKKNTQASTACPAGEPPVPVPPQKRTKNTKVELLEKKFQIQLKEVGLDIKFLLDKLNTITDWIKKEFGVDLLISKKVKESNNQCSGSISSAIAPAGRSEKAVPIIPQLITTANELMNGRSLPEFGERTEEVEIKIEQLEDHPHHDNFDNELEDFSVDLEEAVGAEDEEVIPTPEIPIAVAAVENLQENSGIAVDTDILQVTHCPVTIIQDFGANQPFFNPIRPFGCSWPDCGKGFRVRKGLTRHMRQVHNYRSSTIAKESSSTNCESGTTGVNMACCTSKAAAEQINEGSSKSKANTTDQRSAAATNVSPKLKKKEAPLAPRARTRPRSSRQQQQQQQKKDKIKAERYVCAQYDDDSNFEANTSPEMPDSVGAEGTAEGIGARIKSHVDKPYACDWPNCGKSFEIEKAVVRHKKRAHRCFIPAPPRLKCSVTSCIRSFTNQQLLSNHMKKVHFKQNKNRPSRPSSYKCNWVDCGETFNSTRKLTAHMKTDHLSIGKEAVVLKCPWPNCIRNYTTRKNLNRHMAFHTGAKAVKCPQCGKLLAHRQKLKQHLLIHSGERPYSCSYCEKKFFRKDTLNIHVLQHTGQKPFLCHYCDRAFTRGDNLKTHMTSHTGEMFKCDLCTKQYHRLDSYNRHRKSHGIILQRRQQLTKKEQSENKGEVENVELRKVEESAEIVKLNFSGSSINTTTDMEPTSEILLSVFKAAPELQPKILASATPADGLEPSCTNYL